MFFTRDKKLGYDDDFKVVKEKVDVVRCGECLCLIEKEYAQHIPNSYMLNEQYFCGIHRRKYDSRRIELPIMGPEIIKYYKKIEVDEDGEPVGYKKK